MSITVHNILVSVDSTYSEAKAIADKWTKCVSASEADAVGHTIQAHAGPMDMPKSAQYSCCLIQPMPL